MSRVDTAAPHESIPDMPHAFAECDCGSEARPVEHCWFCGEAIEDAMHFA